MLLLTVVVSTVILLLTVRPICGDVGLPVAALNVALLTLVIVDPIVLYIIVDEIQLCGLGSLTITRWILILLHLRVHPTARLAQVGVLLCKI